MKKTIVILLIFISSFAKAQQQEISIDIGDALVKRTL